jgi:hypothetical protein
LLSSSTSRSAGSRVVLAMGMPPKMLAVESAVLVRGARPERTHPWQIGVGKGASGSSLTNSHSVTCCVTSGGAAHRNLGILPMPSAVYSLASWPSVGPQSGDSNVMFGSGKEEKAGLVLKSLASRPLAFLKSHASVLSRYSVISKAVCGLTTMDYYASYAI